MNQREPPHLPVENRKTLHYVALLLLPTLAPLIALASGRVRSSGHQSARLDDSAPYLQAVGAPPIRFRDRAPPPAQSPPPSLFGAVRLEGDSLEGATNRPDVLLARPTAPPDDLSATGESTGPTKPTAPAAKPPPPPPPSIIPDDTRPTVRPEDFLPFFQLPGSASAPGGVGVIVPVPMAAPTPVTLPPSSATYRQTP
jgi:hypothetical protein